MADDEHVAPLRAATIRSVSREGTGVTGRQALSTAEGRVVRDTGCQPIESVNCWIATLDPESAEALAKIRALP
jgi:hypothetical protein